MIKNIKKFLNALLKEPWVFTSWIVMIAALVAITWNGT
tara:strand:+ start:779 stop:892 length:114 start_codon:yes stop_codon:yes gene_type:complete